ncbi:MAG: DUF3293 domain-containing protein [Acetobacteraceae bacterium]|nr:DUF3293 domain-containing protein [Acetobacteraceae bacterium]
MNRRLLAAYRGTDYEAAGAVARIGRRSQGVDALLRRLGAREGAFVTAWNPWSRRMPPGWNARMMARLREAARRLPRAEGEGRGRGWSERHLLLAGDPRRAAALARRFRQNAIVVARVGATARLVPLRQTRAWMNKRRNGSSTAPSACGG